MTTQNGHLNLPKIKISPKVYLEFPENPGVYIYYKENLPIYVGKANNLKRRIASYFRLSLETKTQRMMSEAEEIAFIKVDSELEALLLEARLIKLFQPKYNIIAKDDKHPLYIQITKEKYPRIITIRKVDLHKNIDIATYGPFPSSLNVKSVLKMVRRIFSYSDHKLGRRPCLYSQIGLCKPCPNEIEATKEEGQKIRLKSLYRRNIRSIKALLDGNLKKVKLGLEKEMKDLSDKQNFEDAAVLRDKISRIEYITNPKTPIESYMENPNLYEDLRDKELRDLKKIIGKYSVKTDSLKRIECFDVAHLQGTNATASMVTFNEGIPDKYYYRHFRIRQVKGQDDYASMREVASRRRKHLIDWGKPNLIIVDGGKGQLSVFLNEFSKDEIPVIGLAKKFETLVIPSKSLGTTEIKEFKLPRGPALNLVQRIRNEAHRFAQAYHHKLFSKSLFDSNK